MYLLDNSKFTSLILYTFRNRPIYTYITIRKTIFSVTRKFTMDQSDKQRY